MRKASNLVYRRWIRRSFVLLVVFVVLGFEVRGYAVIHESSRPIQEDAVWKEETIRGQFSDDGIPIEKTSRIPVWNHQAAADSVSLRGGINDSGGVEAKHHWKATRITATVTDPSTIGFSPFESWCLSEIDRLYASSESVKCPFFRRRLGDALDTLEDWVKHTLIRKDRWPMMGPPQAYRPMGTNNINSNNNNNNNNNKQRTTIKHKGLSPNQLLNQLKKDWKVDTNKGYYVTGRLTTGIYRDDCLFLGPDPDLPMRGLRKYVGVASHLFDYQTSVATLKSLEIITKNDSETTTTTTTTVSSNRHRDEPEPQGETTTRITVVARWKLQAVLRLPWKPSLPDLSGRTIYHTDEEGLIACHEERWEDCSTPKAFCGTFLPTLAKKIWPESQCQAIPASGVIAQATVSPRTVPTQYTVLSSK